MADQSREQQVLESMKGIIDPDLGNDIVTLGFIKALVIDGGQVSFTVELTTPACPLKASFKQQCEEAVGALDWVTGVSVEMGARARQSRSALRNDKPGLKNVAHIIAVSSCKGGVGKSTVAVNLAYSLAFTGARVGLFDADVYGPSLPTLIDIGDDGLYTTDADLIKPHSHADVKLMSFGYATAAKDEAAIMRGPMVSSVINQLLTGTDWGDLDYLIVDFPPGTGDIQLTLLQLVPMDGAVIVTTPQKLSFVDVVKGIQMFVRLRVPTLAVVENMSYFVCDGCDKKHYPFGEGARQQLRDRYGFETSFEIPMHTEISLSGDRGHPLVIEQPDSPITATYADIAGTVAREVSRYEHADLLIPAVEHVEGKGIVVTSPSGEEFVVDPADLRRRCTCAGCVDEHTGEKTLKDEDVPDDIYPEAIRPMGNYAVAIDWSDGHNTSIYPFEKIVKAPE